MSKLPCGCSKCGCICAEHSADGVVWLCSSHVNQAVFRFVIDESCRLVTITLFAGVVLVAAAALSPS